MQFSILMFLQRGEYLNVVESVLGAVYMSTRTLRTILIK